MLETSLCGMLKLGTECFHLVREDNNEGVTFFGGHVFFVFTRMLCDRIIVATLTKFTMLLCGSDALEDSGFVALKNLVHLV